MSALLAGYRLGASLARLGAAVVALVQEYQANRRWQAFCLAADEYVKQHRP